MGYQTSDGAFIPIEDELQDRMWAVYSKLQNGQSREAAALPDDDNDDDVIRPLRGVEEEKNVDDNGGDGGDEHDDDEDDDDDVKRPLRGVADVDDASMVDLTNSQEHDDAKNDDAPSNGLLLDLSSDQEDVAIPDDEFQLAGLCLCVPQVDFTLSQVVHMFIDIAMHKVWIRPMNQGSG